jgi:hypothetical protein
MLEGGGSDNSAAAPLPNDLSPTGDGLRYKLALVLLSRGDAQGALAEVQRET